MNSMTGFGRAEGQVGNGLFTIEIRSVNHRYLDARFRLPPALTQFEIPLSEALRGQCERGSFEINIKHKISASSPSVSGGTRFVVDETAAKSLADACAWLHAKYKTEPALPTEVFAMTNRVFLPVEDASDSPATQEEIRSLFLKALADLKGMRAAEGERLKTILAEGIQELVRLADRIGVAAKDHPAKIGEKLKNRIQSWQLSGPIDAQRLELEIAFYAEKADITEEIDRLRTHAKEFSGLLAEKKAVGRKLDFLTQELHREVNTMGAKASLVEITRLTVEAKTTIEKLREQVQNVE